MGGNIIWAWGGSDFRYGRPGKQCLACGHYWPYLFFRRGSRGKCTCHDCQHSTCYRPKCEGCEVTERTERKKLDRFWVKALLTCRKHWKQDGYKCRQDWEAASGLTVALVASRMRMAWEQDETCEHCDTRWREMPNGIADITVDRVDPLKPFTRSNWGLLCPTGQRDKGRTPPDIWDQKQACWKLWREHRRPRPVQEGLFDGEGEEIG